MSGRQVRQLIGGSAMPVGVYRAGWDGADDAGQALGSGIFFYRLEAGDFAQTRKMTMLR